MSEIKNGLIVLLFLLLAMVLPTMVYFAKSYYALSAEITQFKKNSNVLNKTAQMNNEKLASKLDKVGQTFMNNRYLLANKTPLTKIEVKSICVQKNGINCVYDKQGELAYIGNHEAL